MSNNTQEPYSSGADIGRAVVSSLIRVLEKNFNEEQASDIATAVLYGAVFHKYLKEFWDESSDKILGRMLHNMEGEPSGD